MKDSALLSIATHCCGTSDAVSVISWALEAPAVFVEPSFHFDWDAASLEDRLSFVCLAHREIRTRLPPRREPTAGVPCP